jgi:RND family efflux transporter MFP subunit
MSRLLSVLAIPLLTVALAGCDQSASQTKGAAAPPPPQVTVARPVKRMLADQNEFVGRFVAVDAVEVRARVSGYLDTIHFTDGQTIKKGDLLFTIDRRPFQAALNQAQANLAQAKANLAFAESDLERAQGLIRDSVISRQVYDQRTQAKRVAEASVLAQQAAVNQAELDLEFTELRAAVSGHIGDRRVSQGNLVMGGTAGTTTLLATIQSTDPIRFEFTLDEGSYLRYVRLSKLAPDLTTHGSNIPVQLKLLDEQRHAHKGKMDFVDNAIDRSSGTIRARAEFPNAEGTFTPGMFGRIQVAAGPVEEALLIPEVAIGTEQVRKFVFVVDDQNIVRTKYVTLGPTQDDLRVVLAGLLPEDRVIVNGLMRARAGVKVEPQQATASASPVESPIQPN